MSTRQTQVRLNHPLFRGGLSLQRVPKYLRFTCRGIATCSRNWDALDQIDDEAETGEHVIVTGSGRSGTSLMMQMLNAAGIPCHGEHPSYEKQSQAEFDAAFWQSNRGRAVKLLDPQQLNIWPPHGHPYLFIHTIRDTAEQAMSTIKWLNLVLGFPASRQHLPRLQDSLAADRREIRRLIQQTPRSRAIEVEFESLFDERRRVTVDNIAGFISRPRMADRMAGAIVERSSKCYDGLLESELIR